MTNSPKYTGGYVLNGKYYRNSDQAPDVRGSNPLNHQYNIDRQREDYRRETLQPYNPDGTPNEQFIAAYPEHSKEYGFTQ